MLKNLGTWEKGIRSIVGLVLIAVVLFNPKTGWVVVVGAVGIILAATGLWGY